MHGAWAAALARQLNTVLPKFYVALPLVELGGRVEIDVATAEEGNGAGAAGGGIVWAPPKPAIPVDFTHRDSYEVRVFHEEGGLRLKAAIELVSPANKDRPSTRRAFAAKCASYLAQSASVVIVDVVTDRLANLHGELMTVLQLTGQADWQSSSNLYTVAYRTVLSGDETNLDVWPVQLSIGAPLPRVPLWLEQDQCLPLELEETYQAACESLRIVT